MKIEPYIENHCSRGMSQSQDSWTDRKINTDAKKKNANYGSNNAYYPTNPNAFSALERNKTLRIGVNGNFILM